MSRRLGRRVQREWNRKLFISRSAKRYEVQCQDVVDHAGYFARSLATGISQHKYMTGLRKKSFSAPVHMKRNEETTRLENPRGES
jgi:hypothetical protein